MNVKFIILAFLFFVANCICAQKSELLFSKFEAAEATVSQAKKGAAVDLQLVGQTARFRPATPNVHKGDDRPIQLFQQHLGLPVEGGYAIFFKKKKQKWAGRARIAQNLPTLTVPLVSNETALQSAMLHLPATQYAWEKPEAEKALREITGRADTSFFPKGELVFAPDDFHSKSAIYRLAWKFDLFRLMPDPTRAIVFVDAVTGAVFNTQNMLHNCHVPATGKARYQTAPVQINTDSCLGVSGLAKLRDAIRNIEIFSALNEQSNPITPIVHNATLWNLPSHETPVAAMWAMEKWYDFMRQTFDWEGFTDQPGNPVRAWVHFGQNYNNAFWNGVWVNFGDGDGTLWMPLVSLDIVAHECSHAVVQHSCNLLYEGEPGALNEGLADILAVLTERYAFPQNWNWKMAEAPYFDHANGVRRIDKPNVTQNPASYGGQFWAGTDNCQPGLDNDYCGIHKNSTVLGKFFHILAVGDNSLPFPMQGIGIDAAAQVIFQAMHRLMPTDGFAEMREVTTEVAATLFPGSETSVATAWCNVGVGSCNTQMADSIQILSPNSAQVFRHDDPIEVTWSATPGIQKLHLQISLSGGAGFQTLVTDIPANAQSYVLKAPKVASNQCVLRLVDVQDPLVFDKTDTTFSIFGCQTQAHFIAPKTTICYNEPLFAVNDSPLSNAVFTWTWDGTVQPSPSGNEFQMPALTAAGQHKLALIAKTSAGCTDTFSIPITVLEPLTANFSIETQGKALIAIAAFKNADEYLWYLDGQVVGGNVPVLQRNDLAEGSHLLRLVVKLNGCENGFAENSEVLNIAPAPVCAGDKASWTRITHTNEIIGIAEKDSFLYLAMPGGAARFNKFTHDYQVFTLDNSNLHALPLTCVTLGLDGKIWFGTKSCGIAAYDPATGDFEKLNTPWLPTGKVLGMKSTANQELWALVDLDNDNGQFVKVGTNVQTLYSTSFFNSVSDFFPLDDELLYVSNSGPNYLKKVTKTGAIVDFTSPQEVIGINFKTVCANAQYIFLGALPNKLVALDRSTNTAQVFDASHGASFSSAKFTLLGNAGAVYIASNNKIQYFDGLGKFTTVYDNPTANVNIRFLCLDRENKLWAGNISGLYQIKNGIADIFHLNQNTYPRFTNISKFGLAISPKADKVAFAIENKVFDLSFGEAEELAPNCALQPTQIAIDSFGTIWGINGNKVGKLDFNGNCQIVSLQPAISVPITSSINDIKIWGNWIILKTDGKWYFYNPTTLEGRVLDVHPGFWGFATNDLAGLWALGGGGDTLMHVMPDFSVDYVPTGISSTIYGAGGLTFIPGGGCYFVYTTYHPFQGGFKYYFYFRPPQGGPLIQITALSGSYISKGLYSIAYTSDHKLWMGRSDIGVMVYDITSNKIEHIITTCNGLPSNNVYDIAFAADGRVFFATDNGVAILHPSSGEVVADFEDVSLCEGQPATIHNKSIGASSYRWEQNGVLVGTSEHLTFTPTSEGTQIFTLKSTNNKGCTTSVSKVLIVHPVADLTNFPTNFIECDQSTVIEAPAGMAAYEWRKGNGQLIGTGQNQGINTGGLYTLKITDHCGGTAYRSFALLLSDCVYPGDVNTDGIVDYRDWILMGMAFGLVGPARAVQDYLWYGHPAAPWSTQLPDGTNMKHADCNGDGFIDLADLEAIEYNYGKTHGIPPGLPGPSLSPLHFEAVLLEKPSDMNGNRMKVGIIARTDDGSPLNISATGFVFEWNIPAPLEVVGTPTFNVGASTLGKLNANMRSIARINNSNDRYEFGAFRSDRQNQQNVTLLGAVDFVIIDDNLPTGDSLLVDFAIIGSAALTNNGNFLPIDFGINKFTLVGDGTSAWDVIGMENREVVIFPNPSAGQYTVVLPNVFQGKCALVVRDALGRKAWENQNVLQSASVQVDLSQLPTGTYFLEVSSGISKVTRRLIKTD